VTLEPDAFKPYNGVPLTAPDRVLHWQRTRISLDVSRGEISLAETNLPSSKAITNIQYLTQTLHSSVAGSVPKFTFQIKMKTLSSTDLFQFRF
jgi:hypothetical protein